MTKTVWWYDMYSGKEWLEEGIGRINTYLENSYYIVSWNWENCFQVDYEKKYWSLKDAPRVLAQKWPQDIQTTKWVKAELPHGHIEGWTKMNLIRQETDPMLCTEWRHSTNRTLENIGVPWK